MEKIHGPLTELLIIQYILIFKAELGGGVPNTDECPLTLNYCRKGSACNKSPLNKKLLLGHKITCIDMKNDKFHYYISCIRKYQIITN
jgi:hypothetical protein